MTALIVNSRDWGISGQRDSVGNGSESCITNDDVIENISSIMEIATGSRVSTANGTGTVRFVGNTSFAAGKWIGVELDSPTGKNNGTVQSKTYFSCRDGYGVFVRPTGAKLIEESPRRSLDEPTRSASKVCHIYQALLKVDRTHE
jgi:hypothetical protein